MNDKLTIWLIIGMAVVLVLVLGLVLILIRH